MVVGPLSVENMKIYFFFASLLGITRHLPEHIAVKKSFGRKFIPSFSHFFVTKCPVDEQTQLELYVGAAW